MWRFVVFLERKIFEEHCLNWNNSRYIKLCFYEIFVNIVIKIARLSSIFKRRALKKLDSSLYEVNCVRCSWYGKEKELIDSTYEKYCPICNKEHIRKKI